MVRIFEPRLLATLLVLALIGSTTAAAGQTASPAAPTAASPQDATASQKPDAAAPAEDAADNDDLSINKVEPDFTVVTLPTTLRLPRFKGAFRVTHRFSRPLGQGSFGDLAEDFFGFDGGAQIGLEFRYGLRRGTQVGIYRTSDRTIQLFAEQSLASQRGAVPVGLAVVVAIEGQNNMRETYRPTIGLVVSRTINQRLALYTMPAFAGPTSAEAAGVQGDDGVPLAGFGARLRLASTTYLVGEYIPRFKAHGDGITGVAQIGVGLEKRVGGHAFQVNVSNGVGTTLGQVARGGLGNDDWFIGFNISRKFF